MRIAEIFYSLQGEGELSGMPSVFVRTSGCNLRCSWCDTKYASWEPEGDDQTVDQIAARVLDHPANHCVLTGGEPMIAKNIAELAALLRANGKHITIETAGTIPPNGIACDLASLSPKLTNSTPAETIVPAGWRARHEATRLQPSVLRAWVEHCDYQMKFVVESSTDVEEIETLLSAIGRPIPPSKVLLMPQGTNVETIRGRNESLIDLCLRAGYRYCNRLQIELFGNARGT